MAQFPQSILHTHRTSPGDRAVGVELKGQPPGTTLYIRYQDLQQLPQEEYVVNDDTNFLSGALPAVDSRTARPVAQRTGTCASGLR